MRAPQIHVATPMRIGMLGRVANAKAWDVWLHAIAELTPRTDSIIFDWFGDGPDLVIAKNLATALKIDKIALFHGYVKNSQKALDGLDIFVLSSRWEGGCLPRSALEAMFRGIPCILPRLPSILESIKDYECCILYNPEDSNSLKEAFHKAINNLDRLKYLANKARLHVEENHTSEVEFSKTIKLYKALLHDQEAA